MGFKQAMEKNSEAEQKKAEPAKNFGFITIAPGSGIAEIFKGLGVDEVIEGGQTMNPSTEDILNAADKINAKTIYVLPNNSNIILAANQAASIVEDKELIVIPTKTVPQGITAMINFETTRSAKDNGDAMTDSLSTVKSGQLTYAVRDTSIDGKEIKKDNYLGLGDKGLAAVGTDMDETLLEMIESMMSDEAELISVYYGADIEEAAAEAVVSKIEEKFPDVDVELQLKGIGAKTAENFNRLSVYTVSDLVGLYPRDYDVYHEPVFVKDISHESEHTEVAVEGQVCKSPDIYGSGRLKILTVTIKDYNGDSIKCSWYNMPFLKNTLRLGTRYVFRGRLVNKRGWLLEQPKMYTLAQYKELQGTLQPIYPLTKGLTNNTVTKAVAQALEKYSAGLEKEYIPDYIRKRYSLAEHNFSVVNIHFPKTMEEYVQARHRLAFEEFFLFTLATLSLKSANERIPNSYVIPESKEKDQFLESLSYSLTNAQLRTVSEVAQDMSGEHLCSRLIQGDVGSGKTVVATIALINTVIAGYQGALMAPTEVLARQHYESFVKGFEKAGLDIRVELLVGSMTAKQKKEAYARIADGTAGIIVGTHALIQEKVEYKELALVITD